jgi:hypothetical protein
MRRESSWPSASRHSARSAATPGIEPTRHLA